MRYVCIRNLIGVVFGFKGKPCRNSAFSNTFLLMLNIICFLLAVLNPCFVFCIWKLSLFLSKASLARDVLVGVLCLDMSQGYSTDVDSLLHNSDSFLSIVVVESCCYWTCVTFIIDIGFFCCPVGRPCRGIQGWHEDNLSLLTCFFRNNDLTGEYCCLWISVSSATSVNAERLHEVTRKWEVIFFSPQSNAASPISHT